MLLLLCLGSLQQHFNDMLVRAKIRTIKVNVGLSLLFLSSAFLFLVDTKFTALFSKMWSLKFKTLELTIWFFTAINENYDNSQQTLKIDNVLHFADRCFYV